MMNKDLLKEIILEQAESFKNKKDVLCREVAASFIKSKKISIITGIRRAGKSTLMRQIAESGGPFYYFNFEDERLLDFTKDDFNSLWEVFLELYGERKTIFFDEIQYVKGWEKFVGRLFSDDRKIFLTGSSANLLSRELGTALTGRHIKTELYPFSFMEFLNYGEIGYQNILTTATRAKIKRQFNFYLEFGGFPEVVISRDKNELRQLYQDVLIKDLIVRFKIRDTKSFRELVLYLISNVGSPMSFNNLKKTLGFKNVTTIKNYIDFLEEAYLIFSVPRYDYSVKKQIVNNRKIYGIDMGMIREVAFSFSENSGRILENVVFLELKRRGQEIYYYRDKFNKHECDFLIREGRKITTAIQVVDRFDLNNREREISGLVSALRDHKLKEGIVLTSSGNEELILDGFKIKIKPIWQWLLED